MDSVTPFQLVATCEKISEAYLLPVIRQLLAEFPFTILGFHADNGSAYINYRVATLREKLRIEFTKSRPRHSTDNALAESKNGAVVRKHLGYAHSPQQFAEQVNAFCANHLTRTSTSTARAFSRRRSRMPKERSARAITTRT